LQKELEFYVAWQGTPALEGYGVGDYSQAEDYSGEDYSQVEDTSDDTNDAIGAGKTIKDSAEALIKKLPRPLQYVLKILNEILSLVRGGS
jgi:hypothetical protein